MAGDDFLQVSKMSLSQWFPKWIPNVWHDNRFNFLLVVAGLFSPLILGIVFFLKRNKKQFSLFAFFISYSGIWFWIFTSPDIRFGYHYLISCIVFTALLLLKASMWNRVFLKKNILDCYNCWLYLLRPHCNEIS